MKRRTYLVIMLIFTILIGLSSMASAEEAAHSGQWEFDGAIYLWGASIGGKTGSGSDIDVTVLNESNNIMRFRMIISAKHSTASAQILT